VHVVHCRTRDLLTSIALSFFIIFYICRRTRIPFPDKRHAAPHHPPPGLRPAALTGRKELLEGMLGASLVCFQTYSYARHFSSSCIRVCGYESAPTGVDVKGVLTTVKHCAVGIDAERVEKDTLRPGILPKMEALRNLYQGKKIIVARDKLDVVKGILQKLRAFEKLLQDYPEWRGKVRSAAMSKQQILDLQIVHVFCRQVVMIQVTSPALSDSPKLERQISELVAHINGEYGSLDFVPVHH